MFRLINAGGRAALWSPVGLHDLATVSGRSELADLHCALESHELPHDFTLDAEQREIGLIGEDVSFGPRVPRPTNVFAIGLNYHDHAQESGLPVPEVPMVFTKFNGSIAAPDASIELRGQTVDWEVELVAVVGTAGRDVAVADAWSHIAGVTLAQDISDRHVQMSSTPPQFSLGKSFDRYGPMSATLVSPDCFADRDDIRIWCDLSGSSVQDASTRDLIFTIPQLVEHLSAVCTLQVGDVILIGTPAGVGASRGRFLRPGDVLTSGADLISPLRNVFVGRT